MPVQTAIEKELKNLELWLQVFHIKDLILRLEYRMQAFENRKHTITYAKRPTLYPQ